MNKVYLAGLHYIGITQKKLHKIFTKNQNYKEIFEKIGYTFLKQNGFLEKQISLILKKYNSVKLEKLQEKIDERNVKIVSFFDDDYPKKLRNISNSPFVFYLRGNITSKPKLAIVGSRKISTYGKNVIEKLIPDLIKYFSIISGGAAGCDTKAHKETLKLGGNTISVIGTGIDLDYPVENKKMYDEIVKNNGAVISIFPIGEVGNPYNFPIRNEIVAGLSEGIVVIEAKEKSGSLITARLGLEMGKDIFAVPGDIFRWGSIGTNNLIKNSSAKLVVDSKDILEEYNIKSNNNKGMKKITFSDKIEENIYNTLVIENLNADELSKKLKLDISTINFKLSMMEISSFIIKDYDGKYKVKV